MRSAAHAEHHAVHSQHHQYGRHAAAPPGKLTRLAFWATFHCLAGFAVGEVLGLVIGTVLLLRMAMAWCSAGWVALAADTAMIANKENGVELQAVSTSVVPKSDAVSSTNASSTRSAEVSETHPALVELHLVAYRGRANPQQHATEVAEIEEIALDLLNVGSLMAGEMGPEQRRLNKTKSTPFA